MYIHFIIDYLHYHKHTQMYMTIHACTSTRNVYIVYAIDIKKIYLLISRIYALKTHTHTYTYIHTHTHTRTYAYIYTYNNIVLHTMVGNSVL